ncbi:MAG: hypothetical protein ACI9KE_005468 [Polyangiales bacterium]|jgi:hypothetical protein
MRLQLRAALLFGFALAVPSALAIAQEGDWTVTIDALGYTDTNATQVVTPQAGVSRALDADGGAISARFTVDAISSASVDVVSHATQGFGEVRYQADLAASKRFGDYLPALTYRFSLEPDYESHGAGLSLQSRLGTPDSVLAVGYNFSHDIVSRSGSSNDAFSARLLSHRADLSYTQTLSMRSLIRGAYTMTAQNGYMEKPYRHVPLFRTGTGSGAGFDNFDALRLPTRPLENVPDTRLRHALAVRFLHFIPSADVTLKIDYQFYFDDWSLTAHTVEPRVAWQVSEHVELGLWLRAYRQSGASFWRRTYEVPNVATVPQFRSADRDLSPYTAGTVGLRTAWQNERWGVYVEGSVVQTFFDDFLYLDSLTAVIVQTGLRFTP